MKNVTFTDSANNKIVVSVSTSCNALYQVLDFTSGSVVTEYHETQNTMSLSSKKRVAGCVCVKLKNTNKKADKISIK